MRRGTVVRHLSKEEHLRPDAQATVRHEYVDGYVFAMSGSTEAHSIICGNLFSLLISGYLRGSPCRASINDMKERMESERSYYYPDIRNRMLQAFP